MALLAGLLVVVTLGGAWAARPAPPLPSSLTDSHRARVQAVADRALVSTRVDGEPFVARRDLFEYLLDHPEFASHVTRTLRLARYRIWRTPEGLFLDDGWGTVGRFEVIHAANGLRAMLAAGEYRPPILPNIRGEAAILIEYAFAPAADGRSEIRTAVTGYVTVDSRLLRIAARFVGAIAEAKADREAHRLLKVFARTTRRVEDDPAELYARLRQQPGVPVRELEEFARLLNLR